MRTVYKSLDEIEELVNREYGSVELKQTDLANAVKIAQAEYGSDKH